MSTRWLKVAEIIDDKVKEDKRYFYTRIETPNALIWLPYDKVPNHKVFDYYKSVVNDLSTHCKNHDKSANQIFKLLWKCDALELDSTRKEYLTNRGLILPPSNKLDIFKRIKEILRDPSLCDTHLRTLRADILVEKLIKKREQVLENLKVVERQINLVSDNRQYITITNDVDLELFPHLIYINRYLIRIPEIPDCVAIKCNCKSNDTCDTSSCYHYFRYSNQNDQNKETSNDSTIDDNKIDCSNPYDENGRILYEVGNPVYECNDLCHCDENCPKRVVQKGANLKMEIFRTFNGCGWGVRTLEFIPARTFVCRYAGEVITWEEGVYRKPGYLFDLDFRFDPDAKHCRFTVDAYEYGNISRFINHSCTPNLTIHSIYINNINDEIPEIAFFTKRDIDAGEELYISYEKLVKKGECKCCNCSI